MKRFWMVVLMVLCLAFAGCGEEQAIEEVKGSVVRPDSAQMKAICELATMDCYYHNVAKYYEEDAERFLFWTKDRQFWMEYSGIVQIGIDISQVRIEVENDVVTVTIPQAKVLGSKVDADSFSEDAVITARNSADVNAAHQVQAMEEAQAKMLRTVEEDANLLTYATMRAQSLLEDYITHIGELAGRDYRIVWIYL